MAKKNNTPGNKPGDKPPDGTPDQAGAAGAGSEGNPLALKENNAEDKKTKKAGKPKEIKCTEICTFENRLFKPGMITVVDGEVPPHFEEV
jgi:hypothetical protein